MKPDHRIGWALGLGALLAAIVAGLRCSVAAPLLESRSNWRRGVPPAPTTPTVSSEGLFLLFDSARRGPSAIYRLDRRAGTRRRLTPPGQVEFQPVLSRDGRRFAFTRETGGYQHLWMADSDGNSPTQLTQGRALDVARSFSSDGSGLFFVRTSWQNRGLVPRRELFQLRLTGPGAGQVRSLGPACAISPDENVLLSVEHSSRGEFEIWSRRRDGTDRRRLASGTSPAFSPDGSRIVYLRSAPNYETDAVIMQADGSSPKRVASPPGVHSGPEFCLGGQAVVFRIDRSERFDTHGTYLIFVATQAVERWRETDPP